MKVFLPIVFLAYAFVSSEMVLEEFAPGDRELKIRFLDSVNLNDLSQVAVDGYPVQNVAFMENPDPAVPTLLHPGVMDLAGMPAYRVLTHEPGFLTVETPSGITWSSGQILVDTAFGGIQARVLQFTETDRIGSFSRWRLQVQPVRLEEVVQQADLQFTLQTHVDLALGDTTWQLKGDPGVAGPEVISRITAKDLRILGQPQLKGRLKISNGVIQTFSLELDGHLELEGDFLASISAPAKINARLPLPFSFSHSLQLDKGIYATLKWNAEMVYDLSSTNPLEDQQISFRYLQEFSGDLSLRDGSWKPGLSRLLTTPQKNRWAGEKGESSGTSKITLSPKWHLEIQGTEPVGVDLESFVKSYRSMNFLGFSNNMISIGGSLRGLFAGQEPRELAHGENVVGAPPQGPVMMTHRYITSDSATFSWTRAQDVEFYLLQKQLESEWLTVDTLKEGEWSIASLEPGQTYLYRVLPFNNMGIGIPEVLEFQTPLRNYPPTIPQALNPAAGDSLTGNRVELQWLSGDPDSTESLRYTLLLGTQDPPEKVRVQNDTLTRYEAGLEPGHRYFWQVQVTDGEFTKVSPVWHFDLMKEGAIRPALPASLEGRVAYLEPGKLPTPDGRTLTLSGFYMHKTEVTQKDYERITGRNPSYRKGPNLPVDNVTWHNASQFCHDVQGRLPTEAEWEYAIRAESQTDFYWGRANASNYAWYFENSGNQTHEVGQKKPNTVGLYDMSGNVFEWVEDWHTDRIADPRNPPARGMAKVTRGGSWYSDLQSLKSGARFKNRPGFSSFKLGFRCVFDETTLSLSPAVEGSRESALSPSDPEDLPASDPGF